MPKGPDSKKFEKIIKVLKNRKRGIWIRELARETNMPIATVYYYIRNFMRDDVQIRSATFNGIEHKQMKIVKLKGRGT